MRYTLDDIDTFLAVMELGTVTAAAARLNLAKSVVSKRIADLETSLGAALFLRRSGRITPTEAALRLAERMRPALSDLRAAAESAAWGMDGAAPLRGSLAIAAPMSFGTRYLGPILARFAAAHPMLSLRVDYDDRARDLVREGFDIAVRVGESRDNAMIARTLCTDRMIACASPAYLERHGHPENPTELRSHQIISYAHLPDSRMWRFTRDRRSVTAHVSGRLTLNNGDAIRDMAEAGLGLAMLPGFLVADALSDGRLVSVLADWQTRDLPVLAMWPPVTPLPAKQRALIDHLAAELAGGRPWASAAPAAAS